MSLPAKTIYYFDTNSNHTPKPNIEAQIHLLRDVTTRHARRPARREERVELVVPCLFQHGGRRRNTFLTYEHVSVCNF